MGSWSSKPFGNDTALDWAYRLVSSGSEHHISSPIQNTLRSKGDLDSSNCEETIAAAAVIAAAANEPVRAVAKDISAWIRTQGFVPGKDLIANAAEAVEIVQGASELRELWAEGGQLQEWLTSTRSVQKRLAAALNSDLPTRKPKKPGMPRLLYKLIERYIQDPDKRVAERIRSKLDSIEDVNRPSKDTGHETPLVLVATAGLVDEARSLIERGADPNLTSPLTDKKAVVAACKSGNKEMLELILESGADFVAHHYRTIDEDGTDSTYSYVPALLGAIRFGTPEMIKMVEERGADVGDYGINGETMLYEACYLGNLTVVEFLLQRGFDPNDFGNYHESPIFTAVRGGHLGVVKLLISAGADVNQLEEWGSTPLDYADGKPEIADILVANGAISSASDDVDQA